MTQTEALRMALEAAKEAMHWLCAGSQAALHQTHVIRYLNQALAQQSNEQELDYKEVGKQAYEAGYSTGYMDCAVKMKAQQSNEQVEPVTFDAWYEKFHSFVGKSPLLFSDLHCAWQAAKLYTHPPIPTAQPKDQKPYPDSPMGYA